MRDYYHYYYSYYFLVHLGEENSKVSTLREQILQKERNRKLAEEQAHTFTHQTK
jgi:hypothetical protein